MTGGCTSSAPLPQDTCSSCTTHSTGSLCTAKAQGDTEVNQAGGKIPVPKRGRERTTLQELLLEISLYFLFCTWIFYSTKYPGHFHGLILSIQLIEHSQNNKITEDRGDKQKWLPMVMDGVGTGRWIGLYRGSIRELFYSFFLQWNSSAS